MGAPTKEAVIGTFQNGRGFQDDFLQLKSAVGGNIFAWIDYTGTLQGAFATQFAAAGSDTNVQVNSAGLLYGDNNFTWTKGSQTLGVTGLIALTGTQTISTTGPNSLALSNPTLSTGVSLGVNSPKLQIQGTVWNGSTSLLDEWDIYSTPSYSVGTGPTSTLFIVKGQGAATPQSGVSINCGLNAGNCQFGGVAVSSLLTQFGGYTDGVTFTLVSVANASAGTTTYTGTGFGAFGAVVPNGYVTIAGFVNAQNNGRFQVQSMSTISNTIVVYSSNGVAETHAATATADIGYGGSGVWKLLTYSAAAFGIAGTNYGVGAYLEPQQSQIGLAVGAQDDANNAGYHRVVNTLPLNGNRGYEIGAIWDGQSATPVALQLGDFTNVAGVTVAQLQLATNIANRNSLSLAIQSTYWNGSSSANNVWTLQDVLGTGTNPASTLVIARSSGTTGGGSINLNAPTATQTLTLNNPTITGSGSQVVLGTSTGFGNGAAGTAVTTTLKSTGTGPTTPQTIVNYLQISIGASTFYIPLVQ